MTRKPRKPGRPSKPAVADDAVFAAALELLEQKGLDAVTMRGIARRVGVDPMTLYWHFDSKDALLRDAAAASYAKLRVRLPPGRWPKRLIALGLAYARFLRGRSALIAYLAGSVAAGGAAAQHFDRSFHEAVGDALRGSLRDTARDALVDLVHGAALAPSARGLDDELALLVAGIEARAR